MKRLRSWFSHAFAVEKETEFDPNEDDRALIDVVCAEVVRRHMATPATLFLESTRPLNYIGSQTMTFFEPVMRAVLRNPAKWEQFARILEHRGSIEYLCRRIETLEDERVRKRSSPTGGDAATDHDDSAASPKGDETHTR